MTKSPTYWPVLDYVGARLLNTAGPLYTLAFVKGLFHLQYVVLVKSGRLLIEEDFVRLPNGPVLNDYKFHINRMAQSGVIDVRKEPATNDFRGIKRFISHKSQPSDPELPEAAGETLERALENIASEFKWLNAHEARDSTYLLPPMQRIVSYEQTHETFLQGERILKEPWLAFEDFDSPGAYGRFYAEECHRYFGDRALVLDEDFATSEQLKPFRVQPGDRTS